MEDSNTTQFCEALTLPEVSNTHDPSLPRYLITLQGPMPGTMIPLEPGRLAVGRGEENDVILPEPGVSRRHASVRIDESGNVWLTDLRSTNGTFRNGHRLPAHDSVRLLDGDRIRLGREVVLKFACPVPEEEQFQRTMFERVVRDPLTGLYNRSYFLDQIQLLAQRAPLRRLGLAVIMIDVDHFKAVNDSLGHDAGDTVLREIAARIRRFARSDDLIARYGGEEFAVALPVSAASAAFGRADHIRRGIAARPIRCEDETLHVTASLGIAFAPADSIRGINRLISSADRSLYKAKRAGRNRVDPGNPMEFVADLPLTTVED